MTLAFSGCVLPSNYRIVSAADDGEAGSYILQPNTRLTSRDGQVRVDLIDLTNAGERCRNLPRMSEGLSARTVQLLSDGRVTRALRFQGPNDLFQDARELRTAFDRWWAAYEGAGSNCIAHSAKEAVFRSLLAQRPMAPDQAIEQWYGPSTSVGGPRSLILRPGMRVCAGDVSYDIRDQRFTAGGIQCARLVETSRGPRLEPVTGGLRPPITNAWTLGGQDHFRISSWVELQQPFPLDASGQQQLAYVILYPNDLLTAPASNPLPEHLSWLAIVDVDTVVEIGERPNSELYSALGAVRHFSGTGEISLICSRNVPQIACVRFGVRGTFTVDFPVSVRGRTVDVPVGATLGTLIASDASDFLAGDLIGPSAVRDSADPAARARLDRTLRKVRFRRWFEGRRVTVRVDAHALDLPLQPGDDVTW